MGAFQKGLIILLVLVLGGVTFYYVFQIPGREKSSLITEEVANIREVMEAAKQAENQAWDLEETIRIIHGLDRAKTESEDFGKYLEFMANQDYSRVAPDVVEARLKLLPVLNELRMAEKELENAQELWKTFATVREVVVDDASSLAKVAISSGFGPGMAGGFLDLARESLNAVQEQKNLEKEVKKKILLIQNDYLAYLEDFVPVYLRYMREWDRLCLMRDNAYLEIHQGNIDAALISLEEVLKIHPSNKETLILKAFCLLLKEQAKPPALQQEVTFDYAGLAKGILDQYLTDHPDRSAPALLLSGTYHWLRGDVSKAISLYDQSAVEYPRQSEALLDMLNSYRQRSYLRKTAEGMYILRLYKSTMEGFGFFSPNFQKALIASNNGDFGKAREEILMHFFRRGNQETYDYLISDMVHYETYLPESFNLIFKEKSFLDLEATTNMWNSKRLNIKIKNRSDVRLSNVRIFLCLHFTDMYKDDYEVFKVNTTINHIEPNSTADFGDLEINFDLYGKDKNVEDDIVTARAIIVTDDLISWVDEDDFKITRIQRTYDHYRNRQVSAMELKKYLGAFGVDGSKILELIEAGTSVETQRSYLGKDAIRIRLPRFLVFLNPWFSINPLDTREALLPASVNLNGPAIDIMFNHNVPKNGTIDFYMSSEKARIFWEIFFGPGGKVDKIETRLVE